MHLRSLFFTLLFIAFAGRVSPEQLSMGIVAKPIFLARVHHIEERFPILEVYGQVGADDGMLDKLYDFRIVC